MTNNRFNADTTAFYTETLDFFMQTGDTIRTNKQTADARTVIFFGLFLCPFHFTVKIEKTYIVYVYYAETVRELVRAGLLCLGVVAVSAFLFSKRLINTKSNRRRDMRNAQRTDVQELTFQDLEKRTDRMARDVYEAALYYKEDAVGLYGAIMYAAIKILVKTERLAEPKTEAERQEKERQVSFITDLIYREKVKRAAV